eukprot:scaffold355413_cov35-Prasinocladus_malaysianus.AAC.1
MREIKASSVTFFGEISFILARCIVVEKRQLHIKVVHDCHNNLQHLLEAVEHEVVGLITLDSSMSWLLAVVGCPFLIGLNSDNETGLRKMDLGVGRPEFLRY